MYRGPHLIITLCDECATEHVVTVMGEDSRIAAVARPVPLVWLTTPKVSARPRIAWGG
jgi:hypothetical protein